MTITLTFWGVFKAVLYLSIAVLLLKVAVAISVLTYCIAKDKIERIIYERKKRRKNND